MLNKNILYFCFCNYKIERTRTPDKRARVCVRAWARAFIGSSCTFNLIVTETEIQYILIQHKFDLFIY